MLYKCIMLEQMKHFATAVLPCSSLGVSNVRGPVFSVLSRL